MRTINEISQLAYNNTMRFDKIILIGAATDGESHSNDLIEFLEDHSPDELRELFSRIPSGYFNDNCFVDGLMESRTFGFLVKVATPRKDFSHGGASYSWGSYTCKWVFGETFDQAVENALEWVKSIDAKMKKEQL